MQIGLFQLENLVLTRTKFCFLDLRADLDRSVPEPLKNVLESIQPMLVNEVADRLQTLALAKEHPIVLLCTNGKTSKQVAQKLESLGYVNVYVIEGGVLGLLEEA